jgi:hypothetical protein
VASTFNLNDSCQNGCGNVPYTVYGEYRLVYVESSTLVAIFYSSPDSNIINLDENQPTVALNSPAGLANSDSYYTTGIQPQQVNGAVPQWITWWASTETVDPSETVTMTLYGCGTSCSTLTSGLASGAAQPPSFSWEWSSPVSTDTYLQVKGIDQAGKGFRTSDTAQLFSVFDPTISGGNPATIACGPHGQSNTQPCLVIADGTPSQPDANDIPGDPPAGDSQGSNPQGLLASGYSDPCMRADTVVNTTSNPFGSNIYMTYSYPVLQQSSINVPGYDGTFYSEAVEIHLASSDTGLTTPQPSGQSWCAGDAANCGTETVLFPSTNVGTSGSPIYTSHEVSNFWEVPNYPSSGTTAWFAVHLMYWIVPPYDIPDSIQGTYTGVPGCLVVNSATGSPANLAWTGTQGTSCSNIPSTQGTALTFANLTSWAGLSNGYCSSWGQPAIMVTNQITPSGGTSGHYYMYLATACLDSNFGVLGYYVLYTDYTASQSLTSWSVAAGAFNSSSVASLSGLPTYNQLLYITEFDWFMRPDGTIGAVFTPVTNVSNKPFENGGLAANFNPVAGSTGGTANNPFTTGVSNSNIIANITDADSSGYGSTTEMAGSGSCTYDPISNTGMAYVRRLALSTPLSCSQASAQHSGGDAAACPYNLYILVSSAVQP